MKRFLFACLSAGMLHTLVAQAQMTPAIPRDEQIEQKIESLLRKMTLDEKVGQMCELTIDVIQKKGEGFQIDEAKLDSVITKYKVGSILNVPNGMAVSTAEWQRIIKRIQEKSMKELGIPCIYGVDQIHGTTYTLGGTFFPQGINMGATFNRALMREGSRISALR